MDRRRLVTLLGFVALGLTPARASALVTVCDQTNLPASEASILAGVPSSAEGFFANAFDWVNAAVPYCECVSGPGGLYRTDCSGFVSFIWGLPPPGYVTATLPDITAPITWSDLSPGDAILLPGTHVMLFAGWMDAAQTQVCAVEEFDYGYPATIQPHLVSDLAAAMFGPVRLDGYSPLVVPMLAQASGNDAISLVTWPDQHSELFVTSGSGAVQHSADGTTGDTWSPLTVLDTGAQCGSAVAYWWAPDWQRPEVFSPLSNDTTGHLVWDEATGWSAFAPFGGGSPPSLSHFSTLTWIDGHASVFALGADGAIWESWFDVGAEAWTGWRSLGGSFATGVGVAMTPQNQGALFATDANGAVWMSWSGSAANTPNGWQPWQQIGVGIASRPAPLVWSDGHVELFARGRDGQLYHSSQLGGWSGFDALSPGTQIAGEPSAALVGTSALVFARSSSGVVLEVDGEASGGFGALQPLGAQPTASDPFGWLRGDGNPEVFAIDDAGSLAHSARFDGGWTPWTPIGGGVDPCVPAALVDAGLDAGTDDGGTEDAGLDAGAVVGAPDAGEDGLPLSDAGFESLPVGSGGCDTSGGSSSLSAILLGLGLLRLRRGSRSNARGVDR